MPLHPLVGLDSHAAVHFNFGQQPFSYELSGLPPHLTAPAAATKPREAPTSPASALRQLALAFGRG